MIWLTSYSCLYNSVFTNFLNPCIRFLIKSTCLGCWKEVFMTAGNIFGAIGILATIIFGVLAIKRRHSPGKLVLLKQSTIGLFNNIARNFDEIGIKYKSKPIKENVIYIKASIFNDGDIDIDGAAVEETIRLELKKGLRWIKVKITKTSPGLKCNTQLCQENQKLRFHFGLIRKREFFQFEALVETDDADIGADDIYEHIKISHRIANTQKIKDEELLEGERIVLKKNRMKRFCIGTGLYVLGMILLVLINQLYVKPAPIYYITPDGHTYRANATTDFKVKITNIKSDESRIINLKELQLPSKYMPHIPDLTFWQKIKSTTLIIALVIIVATIMLLLDSLELRKSFKYRKMFMKSAGS